jgi:DNA ligase-1
MISQERLDVAQNLSTTYTLTNVLNSAENVGRKFMLAVHYRGQNPTNWWVSEKYDGIRAQWDGTTFYSRNLKQLTIPQHILATFDKLPMALDGEIWFGRNTLTESIKVSQRAQNINWDAFKFMVFDAPHHGGLFEGTINYMYIYFVDRIAYLKTVVPDDHPYIQLVDFTLCKSRKHLDETFQEALSSDGEGVILREPGSRYVLGRSSSMLKYKVTEQRNNPSYIQALCG